MELLVQGDNRGRSLISPLFFQRCLQPLYSSCSVQNVTNNTNHHTLQSNYWCTIALNPDDIDQGPEEIIAGLKEMEQELVHENQKLTKELEGKNSKRQMHLSKAGPRYFSIVRRLDTSLEYYGM